METQPPFDLQPEDGAHPDELEVLLRRHRFRPPPSLWREGILAAAIAEAPPAERDEARKVDGRSDAKADRSPWMILFGSGWSLIAAAWVLVFLLNVLTAPVRRDASTRIPPLSAAARAELASQMAALAEGPSFGVGQSVVDREVPVPSAVPATPAPTITPGGGRPRAGLRRFHEERHV